MQQGARPSRETFLVAKSAYTPWPTFNALKSFESVTTNWNVRPVLISRADTSPLLASMPVMLHHGVDASARGAKATAARNSAASSTLSVRAARPRRGRSWVVSVVQCMAVLIIWASFNG